MCPPAQLVLLACELAGLLDAATATCGMFGYHDNVSDIRAEWDRCDAVEDETISQTFRHFAEREDLPEVLLEQILTGYPVMTGVDATSPFPVNAESVAKKPLSLIVDLSVSHISNINHLSQTFDLQYELVWRFRDCRLLSRCKLLIVDHGSLEFRRLWRPAYLIEERVADERDIAVMQYYIMGDGSVTMTEDRHSTFRCKFHFAEMPFDVQACALTIRLPGTSSNRIMLTMDSVNTSQLELVEWYVSPNEEWNISSSEEFFPFPKPHFERVVTIQFTLTRRKHYQMTVFMFPSIIFYVLSWVGLWMDHGAVPARVAVGIIPVLTMTNTLIGFAKAMPPISYETRIHLAMLYTLGFIGMHLVEYGAVHTAWKLRSYWQAQKSGAERLEAAGAERQEAWHARALRSQLFRGVVDFLCDRADIHLRWLSPAGYILQLLVNLHG